MNMKHKLIHQESLTSKRTQALFIALSLLFLLLMVWRAVAHHFDFLAGGSLFLSVFFLFYVFNYRTLNIHLTTKTLKLKFGLFEWTIPMDNIENCRLDELPAFKRLGGAGIHFMKIRGRYRASFNFLEYPRVVIALKRKAGPVQDISFSTCQPDEIIKLIHQAGTLPPANEPGA